LRTASSIDESSFSSYIYPKNLDILSEKSPLVHESRNKDNKRSAALLKKLCPRMVVAENVKELNGNILIYKGDEIEDKRERILRY